MYNLVLSLSLIVENTRMQSMQAAINKRTKQFEGYNDQLAAMTTHVLASLQVQLAQRMEHSPRHSSSHLHHQDSCGWISLIFL